RHGAALVPSRRDAGRRTGSGPRRHHPELASTRSAAAHRMTYGHTTAVVSTGRDELDGRALRSRPRGWPAHRRAPRSAPLENAFGNIHPIARLERNVGCAPLV